MAADLLSELKERIDEDLDGLTRTSDGLTAIVDARYGEVSLDIEHDDDAGSLRVSVAVPPPAGAGLEFLLFCLHCNTQYWDVKFGLDDDGRVLVHADLDADEGVEMTTLAAAVIDRAETVVELVDDDLTEWMLAHGFGTPSQRERWESRRPTAGPASDES